MSSCSHVETVGVVLEEQQSIEVFSSSQRSVFTESP